MSVNVVRVQDRSGRIFMAEWRTGERPAYRIYEADGETRVQGVTEVTIYFEAEEMPTIEFTVRA